MAIPSRAVSPTVLGLDVGMTATRASLYKIEWKGQSDRQPFCVSCPKTEGTTEGHNTCNFPAIAYPFHIERDPAACLGFRTDTRSHPFPLKMFCYFLRTHYLRRKGELDKFMGIRKRIPQLDQFWAKLEIRDNSYQNQVIAHLHKIFVVHLKFVRSCSKSVAERRSMRITKIAATLPPDWDIPLQKIYEGILGEVWNDIGESNITVIFESEAVGHWLLRQDTQDIRRLNPDKIVLADFGGHTLSSYVFDIVRGKDDESFAFFSSFGWEAECSLGGSELHSTLVKSKLEKKIERERLELTPVEIDHLISNCMLFYRTGVRTNIDGQPFNLRGEVNSEPYDFPFRENEAKRMYEDCFKAGLPRLFRMFRKVAQSSQNVVVVLSGGSFLNQFVLGQTIKAINEAGLKHLPWIEEMADAGRRPGIVSMGAAMALVNELTVDEFLGNASFAIDTCQPADVPLPILLDKEGSRNVTVHLRGNRRSDVYIACAPLAPLSSNFGISRQITYEFQMIDRHTTGTYSMSLKHERGEDDNTHYLVFTQQRLDSEKSAHVDERRWPIYYDPGACVCFIDCDKVQQGTTQSRGSNDTGASRPRRAVAQYRKIWQQEQTNLAVKYWQDSLDELNIEDWREWIEQLNSRLRSPLLGHGSNRGESTSQRRIGVMAASRIPNATQIQPYHRAPMAQMAPEVVPEYSPLASGSSGLVGYPHASNYGQPISELDSSHQSERLGNSSGQASRSAAQKRAAEPMNGTGSYGSQPKRHFPS